jgi:transposase
VSSQTMIYSEAFKLQVVNDLETGRFSSPHEVSRAYGIRGANTVARWVRKYGKSHLLRKVIRVTKKGEPGELKRLRERTRKLEELVADLTMDKALAEALLNIACEETGLDVAKLKKKAVATKSNEHGSKSEGGGK